MPLRKSVIVAALFLLCTHPGSSQDAESLHRGHDGQGRTAAASFAELMSSAMDTMHRDMAAAPRSGDADRDFLAMMIPHHAGAVEMARLVLLHGRDPLVRQLAEEIIAGQQAEIGGMEARLRVLERGPDPRPDGFPAVTGTRGK